MIYQWRVLSDLSEDQSPEPNTHTNACKSTSHFRPLWAHRPVWALKNIHTNTYTANCCKQHKNCVWQSRQLTLFYYKSVILLYVGLKEIYLNVQKRRESTYLEILYLQWQLTDCIHIPCEIILFHQHSVLSISQWNIVCVNSSMSREK